MERGSGRVFERASCFASPVRVERAIWEERTEGRRRRSPTPTNRLAKINTDYIINKRLTFWTPMEFAAYGNPIRDGRKNADCTTPPVLAVLAPNCCSQACSPIDIIAFIPLSLLNAQCMKAIDVPTQTTRLLS
jgi:hypothetical protein